MEVFNPNIDADFNGIFIWITNLTIIDFLMRCDKYIHLTFYKNIISYVLLKRKILKFSWQL